MASNENVPDSLRPKDVDAMDAENKKGQMLVIYLPEGSVIVDRTDIDLSTAPREIIERTITVPTARERANEASQPKEATLQELVQMTVKEVLQNTTKLAPEPETVPTSATPQFDIPIEPRQHVYVPRITHGVHFPRRRLNWVHGLNTLLVTYIVLVSVLPAVLSSFFGVAIYASKVAHPGASIASGDLMVCKQLAASDLKVNDVVLLRNGNTWRLDPRQVVSRTSDASLSTVTTASTAGQASNTTLSMANTSEVYKVSTIVPKLGYVPMILSDTITKVIGALLILVLNLMVHYRRSRRRRLGIPVQPI